jgi:GDPmannose 4,6-dehydratase
MIALIFGVSGQDGFYLSKLLKLNGINVIGISRTNGDEIGDISDKNFVNKIITKYKPNYIFHFAAISSTSHDCLFENHQTISGGTINILESIKINSIDCKIFISGSAMQFKNDSHPISETTPFIASSTYSAERIYSVYLSRYYRTNFGIKSYVGYFFNHDSSLRNEKHINKKITNFVNNCKNGDKIIIGDLNVKKEFNFAGDIVEAVWTLVNQEKIFEVVIGSGKAYSIKDWIKLCFNKKDLNYKDFVVTDRDFKSEYDTLVSDPQLIKSLGWEPRLEINDLANLMLNNKL